jgi:galacturonosyltransferase
MSKIILIGNDFLTLYLFRTELIKKLLTKYNVVLIIPEDKNDFFKNLGCSIEIVQVPRRSTNPFKDLVLFFRYLKLLLKHKSDVLLTFTVKPNVYGGLANFFTRAYHIANITGLGGNFENENLTAKIIKILYKIGLSKTDIVFFQNQSDLSYFQKNRLFKGKPFLIPGSGVNLEKYTFSEYTSNIPTVFTFIGRIMKIKGIDNFLLAANKIHSSNCVFQICGYIEDEEYNHKIMDFANKGVIKYLGFREDIDNIIQQSTCVILPSLLGEGVPNSVLEANAVGRIAIVSNIPGSTDIIEHKYNGFIFDKHDLNDMIKQIEEIKSMSLKELNLMAKNARLKVEKKFNRKIVVDKYMKFIEMGLKNSETIL